MSYVFTSPKYYVRQCPTDSDSLGLVGPDQPWSAQTAGKEIAPATKECHKGWQKTWNIETEDRPYHDVMYAKKKGCTQVGWGTPCITGDRVRDYPVEECFKTGRIDESRTVGGPRRVWWCCPPVPVRKPDRAFTEAESEEYGEDVCPPFYHEGQVYLGEPKWIDNNFTTPTGWTFQDTDIIDGGYRLYCTPVLPENFWKDYMESHPFSRETQVIQAKLSEAEKLLQHEQLVAEQEAIVQEAEAEFEYSFFERYGLYMAVGAGVIGLGLLAGYIKRSLS